MPKSIKGPATFSMKPPLLGPLYFPQGQDCLLSGGQPCRVLLPPHLDRGSRKTRV